MVNGVSEALLRPLLAAMVICPVDPSSLGAGLPVSAPVLALKFNHFGNPVAVKVTTLPPADTVGWKE
jgi:hypothetical protein